MTAMLDLETIHLTSGSHSERRFGVCAMEAAAWLAGEPHSDHPECVCPIIGAFVRSWNDGMPNDDERDRLLKPLLPLLLNTADPTKKDARAFMAIDWIARQFVPAWLELNPALKQNAEALRLHPEITSLETLLAITPILVDAKNKAAAARDAARAAAWDAARDAAWAAARAAAWDAARDAAWAAAWAAARDAAWAAARDAARDAAWDAAWAAARDAAWDAARDAAWDAAWAGLKPVTEKLQLSASELVKRMCAA